MTPALEVHQLTVNYDRTPVLWDIELSIPQGCLAAICGPNGAGKSTLIKTALGLITPISGTVAFFGKTLKEVRQRVGYVPQRESVDWDFPITVLDLVLMGRYGRLGLFRRPRSADVDAARHTLERVGMSAYADRQISQLSGGQQQRVFLARALLQEADLYLMDEPFAGIDHTTERVLLEMLNELKDAGKTVVVVHHDLDTVRDRFDWAVLLNMRLVSCGPVEEAFTPDYLDTAYGKSHVLFDEAARLTQTKESGLI
jgi:manganese/zinc/iron transport system ATP- binding protein